MKSFQLINWSVPVVVLTALIGSQFNNAAPTTVEFAPPQTRVTPVNAVANALPFTLEFVEKKYGSTRPLPGLQSYVAAPSKGGDWLFVGGRRQGLHTFEPAPVKNFIPDSANNLLLVINPTNGQQWSFDVNKLPPALSAPLQAANQQSWYDRATRQLYIVGGYGWKADKTDMITFNTILRFKVDDLVAAIKTAQPPTRIATLIEVATDDRLAVTGGELFQMNSTFYLVFGQKFTGQYRAFGGSDFEQTYTEEVRNFRLMPNQLKILSYGATTNTEPDRPFHRRDGNIIHDINPTTGKPRIAAFGGVFKPGIIGAYTYPIYIDGPGTPTVDRTGNQKFSQYGCPVISVYDGGATRSVYHTFFGGIGHYYYAQTPTQKAVYDSATQQGRNDGMPFVADVTTFLQSANGTYKEFIHPNPIPGNRLAGSSVPFLLNQAMVAKGYTYENGVINLARIPKQVRLLIGYIYGGVEARNPLPSRPNSGTSGSSSVFGVYLTYKPSAAIPANQGHQSVTNAAHLSR